VAHCLNTTTTFSQQCALSFRAQSFILSSVLKKNNEQLNFAFGCSVDCLSGMVCGHLILLHYLDDWVDARSTDMFVEYISEDVIGSFFG
jgi:hypothetical protein